MKHDSTLRITRIAVAAFCFIVLTVGLSSPAWLLPVVGPWLEKIQIVPALAAFSLATFVAWLMVTLMFGRLYCSTVCPLGTLQDIAARAAGHPHRRAYRYTRPRNTLRNTILVAMLICLMLQNAIAVTILDPYSEFAGFCSSLIAPVAGISGTSPSALLPLPSTILAVTVFVATIVVSARGGRTICNTICPVGTTLGLVSRFAVFQIDIDTDKCTQCGRCRDVCKSSCIDLTDHVVDGSRCVNCFDCLPVCPNDAIHYTNRRKRLATPMMQRISDNLNPTMPRTSSGALSTFDKTPPDKQ